MVGADQDLLKLPGHSDFHRQNGQLQAAIWDNHQTVVTSAHLLKRNVAQKSSLFSWVIPCQSIQGSTCIIIIIYPVPSVMLCPS